MNRKIIYFNFLLLLTINTFNNPVISQNNDQKWDKFLDTLQERTIRWFLETTDIRTGLTPDRWPTTSPSSIAAVGFALTIYPIAFERGIISRGECVERTLNTLKYFLSLSQNDKSENTSGYKGFFYHFLGVKDGTRYWKCELSTIDTGLLLAGVLFCQSYFRNNNAEEDKIRELADSLYRMTNWKWAYNNKKDGITFGWDPEHGFNEDVWYGYTEAMIMNILALGSPTDPLPESIWKTWTSKYIWAKYYEWDFISFGPLFGHQYSHVWIDFRGIKDAYLNDKGIDYFENSQRATYSNRAYAKENPQKYNDYSEKIWGISACDGPMDTVMEIDGVKRKFIGYGGRGVSFDWVLDDGTLTPTAAGGSIAFSPEICINTLKAMRDKYGEKVYRKYGFIDAFNPTFKTKFTKDGWFDTDYLGIDQGPIAIMIENLRNGFVWNVMKKNPYIINGLKRAGFTGGWLEKK